MRNMSLISKYANVSGILKNQIFPVLSLSHGSVRNIMGKNTRRPEEPVPKPFPYWRKRTRYWHVIFDPTFRRFRENTKVIHIEGPMTAGKHELAKQLAEEFGMKYYPDATMDMYYTSPNGYDLRNLDPKLPFICRSFDEKNFCENPYDPRVPAFQFTKYKMRYSVYWDALTHLFSTGQGVVCVRSSYSDVVFAQAMNDCGYISDGVMDFHNDVQRHVDFYMLRPHIIIYLDVPVPKIRENILKRAVPHELNSPALTDRFLERVEYHYKNKFLPTYAAHSKILIYDWSEGGNKDFIVEDIEKMDDLDKWRQARDPVLADWNLEHNEKDQHRLTFGGKKLETMNIWNQIGRLDVPEMLVDGNDMKVWSRVWEKAPGIRWATGYDPATDKNILFKHKDYEPDYLPNF